MQVSSVNRRSLDLTVKLPDEWESLEAEIAERVRQVASRGKVHVDVEFSPGKGREEPSWNDAVGRCGAGQAGRARGRAPDPLRAHGGAPLAYRELAAGPEPRCPRRTARGRSSTWPSTRRCAAFAAMRAREGEALFVDFIERVGRLPQAP